MGNGNAIGAAAGGGKKHHSKGSDPVEDDIHGLFFN